MVKHKESAPARSHPEPASVLTSKRMPWVFLVILLIMIFLVLVWNAKVRYHEFIHNQNRLMQSSVNGVSAQLEIFISELRRAVHLFADTERERLDFLAENPDDEATLKKLNEATHRHFPHAFALTIADKHGDPLITDYDGLIGDICIQDMHTFSKSRLHSEIYIHPHPGAYHFDIMVDWEQNTHSKGIFFVSFRTGLLSEVIKHGQLPGHQLLLLNKNIPGLIEVTAGGARIKLKRPFFLTLDEMQRIDFSMPVKGTAWRLVDLPDASLYKSVRNRLIYETSMVMLTFIVVSGLLMWLYRHAQGKQRIMEHKLNHDPVTGLPNRHHLMNYLEKLIDSYHKSDSTLTLLLIDLGSFRRLKGTFFEHRVDDTLVKEVAMRLNKYLDNVTLLARIDDHDYAAILSNKELEKNPQLVASLLTELKKPYGQMADITLAKPCIGVATYPSDGANVYALIRHAGMQLYAARQKF